MIPSDTESESDTESDDGLGSLVGRQGEHVFAIKIMGISNLFTVPPQWRVVEGTNDEVDGVDFTSGLFKSTNRVEPQSVARVGGNGEWGIHGIIGKEVIEGKVYYCMDWEPMMVPVNKLWGARCLV